MRVKFATGENEERKNKNVNRELCHPRLMLELKIIVEFYIFVIFFISVFFGFDNSY